MRRNLNMIRSVFENQHASSSLQYVQVHCPHFQALSWVSAALITVNTTAASYCLAILPMGDTGVITHSAVIFTLFFSRVINKTPITVWKTAWTLLLFTGLLLVVKPTTFFSGGKPGKSFTISWCFSSTHILRHNLLRRKEIRLIINYNACMCEVQILSLYL